MSPAAPPIPPAPERPRTATNAPIKVFVRGLNWVGDAIMATPALAHLRKSLPEAQITLMVRPWVAAVYEHNPDIDRLWTHDDAASTREFMKAVSRIRAERFQIGIALPNSTRSALLMRLGGIAQRYGFRTSAGRGLLLNHAPKPSAEVMRQHQVYFYLELIESLCGPGPKTPRQTVYPGELEREEVARLLRNEGLDRGQPLVGLAPGSINSMAKRWPAERFAETADRLRDEMGASVLLLGSAREQDVLDRTAARARGPVANLGGRVNLAQLIALMERLDGLITNDAGGMHLAAALLVPTVAIFGPTEWHATYPFSPLARIVRKEGVECAPCMLRECPVPGHPCMTGVTVEMVLDAFFQQLDAAGRKGEHA